MARLRRLSEFGHARGDPQGRRWGPENDEKSDRSEDCGLTEAHNGDHFDHYVLTKDWMHWFYVFFYFFFGFVNNENRAENDFLKAELSSDFHSRTHQKEIKRLNLSMEGGINGSVDCFFSVSLSIVPCVDVNSFQVAHPSLDLTLWLFWKIITVNSSVVI